MNIALLRDERHIAVATDFLRSAEGLLVDRNGIRPLRGWGCLVVFLDYLPFPLMHTGPDPPRLALGGEGGIDAMVRARDVRAIEVYRTIDEVPDELRQGRQWGDIHRCSVIWLWTGSSW